MGTASRRGTGIMSTTLGGIMLIGAQSSGAQVVNVDIGGIELMVSESWTAQVFHIVDQLSEWSEFSHRGYGRWAAREFDLTAQDRELLQRHAELRRARDWNNGFEAAFYVDVPIERAAATAVANGLLSPDEAAAEVAILLHFEQRLRSVRDQYAQRIAAFKSRLSAEAERIRPIVRQLAAFVEAPEVIRLPLYLVTNPEEGSGGGGFHSGVLVVEVQENPDPLWITIHEAIHAFLRPRWESIQEAAGSAGLEYRTLNEGIAYAMAPGLVETESDTLAEGLARFVLAGTPPTDSYVQFYSVAAVIRPLLRAALDDGETLTTFLPRAAEKWRSFRQP